MMAGEQYREWTNSAVVLNSYNNGIHDVILQGLEQSLRYGESEVYYPTDSFKDSIEEWQGIPIIYVPSGEHIPVELFNSDPEQALQQYNAVPIGNIQEPKVMEEGQRRLQAKAAITNAEYEDRIKSGDIQISTSFRAPGNNRIESPVLPSYVLAFDKSVANPRDKLTMFLNNDKTDTDSDFSQHNKPEELNMSEADNAAKMANLERDLSEKDKVIERTNTELKEKDSKVKELSETVERLNTEKTEMQQKVEQLETQLTEYANAEANRHWEMLKSTTIPQGLVAKDEDEKAMRELYNTDKDAFYMKILEVQRPAETPREGNAFENNEPTSRSTIGSFNPKTGEWE